MKADVAAVGRESPKLTQMYGPTVRCKGEFGDGYTFKPPQPARPAASVAQFLTAAYRRESLCVCLCMYEVVYLCEHVCTAYVDE